MLSPARGHADIARSGLELLVVTVGNRLGIPFEESARVARALEDNWFDTPSSLADLTAASTAEMGIPPEFASSLRAMALAQPMPGLGSVGSTAATSPTQSTASLMAPSSLTTPGPGSPCSSRMRSCSPQSAEAHLQRHLARQRLGREQRHQALYEMRISGKRTDQVTDPWLETTSFRRSARAVISTSQSRSIAGACMKSRCREMCAEIAPTVPDRQLLKEIDEKRSRVARASQVASSPRRVASPHAWSSVGSPQQQSRAPSACETPRLRPPPSMHWRLGSYQPQSGPLTPRTPRDFGASDFEHNSILGLTPRWHDDQLKHEGSFKVAGGMSGVFLAGA